MKLITSDPFDKQVQHALINLYNPAELQLNPLIRTFALEKRPLPMESLRQVIEEAIQALKPAEGVPLRSDSWRIYQLLRYRFIEQISQKEVASDFSLSVRQLRRLEKDAIVVLANYLNSRVSSSKKVIKEEPKTLSRIIGNNSPAYPHAVDKAEENSRTKEILCLMKSQSKEVVNLLDVLQTVMKLCERMIQDSGLTIEMNCEHKNYPVAIQVGAIRQAIISLITAVCQSMPDEKIIWTVNLQNENVILDLAVIQSNQSYMPKVNSMNLFALPDLKENLDMVEQLVTIAGGRFETSNGTSAFFSVRITLPVAQQIKVLIIDDNIDALGLIDRYLDGTQFQFIGVRDPANALQKAIEEKPRVILLDVMLPGIDGWDLLGQFREHPQVSKIPVIISTILPQEKLAFTLGAAGFIRKPLDRINLIAALEQQVSSE